LPAPVVALVALFVALMGLGELTSPAWRSDDELLHVDMVRHIADEWGWPGINDHFLPESMWNSFRYLDREWEKQPSLTVDEAPARNARPGFSAFDQQGDTAQVNWMAQHPPAYYWLMAGMLQAANVVVPGPDVGSFMQELSLLRWANLLLLAPLPALAWATARRLRFAPWLAVSAAAVPVAVPLFVAVGPVVGNDSLLILEFSVLTWLLARVITGDDSLRTALAVGGVGALALLTKGFALLVPPWILLAYVVAGRSHGPASTWRRPTLVAMAVAVLAGGWWWLRNLVVEGSVQPRSSGILPPTPEGFEPNWLWWLGQVVRRIAMTLWSPFQPWELLVPLMVVALVAVVVAWRVSPDRRWHWVVMLVPAVGLTALMMVVATSGYALTGKVPGIHVRYVLGGTVGMTVVVACGLGAMAVRAGVSRWLGTGVVALALVIHAWALRTAVGRFWGRPGESTVERFDDLVAWSTWPPAVLAVAAIGTIVLAVWALREQVRAGLDAPVRLAATRPSGPPGAVLGQHQAPLGSAAPAATTPGASDEGVESP
jgi:4-amino-4-deoxy-L-arabinose transferase-like glycosyltransferase